MPIRAHFSRMFGLGSDRPSPKPNGPRPSLEPVVAVVCRGRQEYEKQEGRVNEESEKTRLWEI